MGWVYLAECRDLSLVKIGFTNEDPSFRVTQLQTGCPAPLSVAGAFPGDTASEREMHVACAKFATHGEWFRDCAELRAIWDARCDVFPRHLRWFDPNDITSGEVCSFCIAKRADFISKTRAWGKTYGAGICRTCLLGFVKDAIMVPLPPEETGNAE